MRRFLILAASLLGATLAYAGNSSLTVSSGTFKAIDGWNESTNSQFRQSVVIADPNSLNGTAPVDPVGGVTVRLSTSTASGIGTLTGITNAVTVQQTTPASLQSSVSINGSSNTVAATQSGTWTVQPGNTANTTAWKVDGSAVTQPVSGTVTAAQTTSTSLRASVSIDGSSNTVAATVTQSTPASLRSSVSIDGSSNTVTAAQTTPASLRASVSIDGSSNTISGTVTANQGGAPWSQNITQVNSTTLLAGNGATGTGSPRVTVASDNTPYGIKISTDLVNASGTPVVCVDTFTNVAASQTDASIVSGIASTVLRVYQLAMVTGGTATNVTFNSKGAGAGTAISPLFANAANGGAVFPFSIMGWFSTNSGESLTVTTGAGSTTGIFIRYCKF